MPAHPATVGPDEVAATAALIEGDVRRTPVLRIEPDALGLGVPVWLKLESQQLTGSFKVRNAVALLRDAEVPAAGVVAVSGGNFGLGVAHAAAHLGHPLTVFVPAAASTVKVDGIRRRGAQVHVIEGPIAELFAAAEAHVATTGALWAHPFDQPEVVAGAGTCAYEFDAQCPDLDTVLVAVGGGGLLAGVAAWFGDRTRVIAVETTGTPTLHAARRAGEPVDIEPEGLGTSALGAPRIGALGWDAAQRWVDDALLVSDAAAVEAQRRLWETARLVAEVGGAVALAALTSGAYVPDPDERVGVIVCGGNTDPSYLVGPG